MADLIVGLIALAVGTLPAALLWTFDRPTDD